MSYPTKYSRQYDYVGYQNANPTRPLPATSVNADLNQAALASGEVVDFLKTSLRADGAIMNGAIGSEQLSPDLLVAGLAPAAAWASTTAYVVGENVVINTSLYRCAVAHIASVFATDFASGYWVFVTALQAGQDGVDGVNGTNGAGYGGTSTTSLTIGTGSKVFSTQSGLAYLNGAYVRASSSANPANYVEGLATYSSTTLTINATAFGGSGTAASWNFNIAGIPGSGDPPSTSYTRPETNAKTRTVQSRLTDRASWFDFIPAAQHAAIQAQTSTYDVAADVQAAINALAGVAPLYVPHGKFKFLSGVRFAPNTFTGIFAGGLQMIGDGPGSTILDNQVAASARSDTFDSSNGSVIYTVHRTAHGKTVDSQITINSPNVTVGAQSLAGTWNVASVPDANTFTFNHSAAASSTQTGISVTYNEINPLIDLDTGTNTNFQHFIHLKNFRIENSISPTKSTAIRMRRAYKTTLEDIWIKGMTLDGIHITTPNQISGDRDGPNGLTFRHVRLENCAGWGLNCDLRPGNNELSYLMLDDVFVSGCGTTSAAAVPPSGGIRWKGQVLDILNSGLVINQNVGLFIEGAAGLSNTIHADCFTVENNLKKGVFITGVQGAEFSNFQCYNNDGNVATSGIELDASNFSISNVRVNGAIVRATSGNNPYTAFKASGANLQAETCRVDLRDVAFQTGGFPAAGQAKWSGWSVDHSSFSAHKNSVDQTAIVPATWTPVTFGTEVWDDGDFYSVSTSRWTPPPGKVKLTCSVYISVGAVDQAQTILALYKNGVALKLVAITDSSGTAGFVVNGSCSDVANGTDYYEVWVNAGGAGNKTIAGGVSYTWFQGEMF